MERRIQEIAEGKNPYVNFPFSEVSITRGTREHAPHTDVQEVKSSITVRFTGVPGGAVVAHLFNDGTIKTSAEMHAENNRRKARDESLTAEESKFPDLDQTAARKASEAVMLGKIGTVRDDESMSIMDKQIVRDMAQQVHARLLREQEQQRVKAAARAASKK